MLRGEEGLEEDDRVGTPSFVAGGVVLTSSGVGGETDLPFLPDGAGNPFGQGFRGTRGLFAVFAEAREDRVLSRELSGAFLGLVSALQISAEGFKRRWRSSQWVGSRQSTQHTTDARTFVSSPVTYTRMALGSHHSTGDS